MQRDGEAGSVSRSSGTWHPAFLPLDTSSQGPGPQCVDRGRRLDVLHLCGLTFAVGKPHVCYAKLINEIEEKGSFFNKWFILGGGKASWACRHVFSL